MDSQILFPAQATTFTHLTVISLTLHVDQRKTSLTFPPRIARQ